MAQRGVTLGCSWEALPYLDRIWSLPQLPWAARTLLLDMHQAGVLDENDLSLATMRSLNGSGLGGEVLVKMVQDFWALAIAAQHATAGTSQQQARLQPSPAWKNRTLLELVQGRQVRRWGPVYSYCRVPRRTLGCTALPCGVQVLCIACRLVCRSLSVAHHPQAFQTLGNDKCYQSVCLSAVRTLGNDMYMTFSTSLSVWLVFRLSAMTCSTRLSVWRVCRLSAMTCCTRLYVWRVSRLSAMTCSASLSVWRVCRLAAMTCSASLSVWRVCRLAAMTCSASLSVWRVCRLAAMTCSANLSVWRVSRLSAMTCSASLSVGELSRISAAACRSHVGTNQSVCHPACSTSQHVH
jgi:hypothetical protein